MLPRGEQVEKLKVEQKWFYVRCGSLRLVLQRVFRTGHPGGQDHADHPTRSPRTTAVKLEALTRLACNLNRHLPPQQSIVIRIGVFTSFGNTIARPENPHRTGRGLARWREFNTNFLDMFSDVEIIGTIIHEGGHAGMGWSAG